MNRKILTWLKNEHPEAKVEGFDADVTFDECWCRMNAGEDFRTFCRCEDNDTRRLVFGEIAEMIGVPQTVVFDVWLKSNPSFDPRLVRFADSLGVCLRQKGEPR